MGWRGLRAPARPRAIAVAVGFLANSYEGADRIRAIVRARQPWSDLTTVNIDAVTRWFYQGMPVDGLQRLFLYQPHHLTGYMLALCALWLVGIADDVTEISVGLWAGILLGFTLLFSTFTALIVGQPWVWCMPMRLFEQGAVRASAVRHPRRRAGRCGRRSHLGSGLYRFTIPAPSSSGSQPRGGPARWPCLAPEFRPAPVRRNCRVPAVVVDSARWRGGSCAGRHAFMFYFLPTCADSGDVWVGWRSGHLLLIVFSVWAQQR